MAAVMRLSLTLHAEAPHLTEHSRFKMPNEMRRGGGLALPVRLVQILVGRSTYESPDGSNSSAAGTTGSAASHACVNSWRIASLIASSVSSTITERRLPSPLSDVPSSQRGPLVGITNRSWKTSLFRISKLRSNLSLGRLASRPASLLLLSVPTSTISTSVE